MLMDVLMIATGFSGAMTLLWLARLLVRRFLAPAGAVVHFGPGSAGVDTLVREIAAARQEVLLMAETLACPPLAQALVDVRQKPAVRVDVLLGPAAQKEASDFSFLVEQGLVPQVAGDLGGLVVVVDGKTVVLGSGDIGGTGVVLMVRGQADLARTCREQFAARSGRSGEPSRTEDSAARLAAPTLEPALGPIVTQATDELFARMRQEAAAAGQDESADEAA